MKRKKQIIDLGITIAITVTLCLLFGKDRVVLAGILTPSIIYIAILVGRIFATRH